MCFLVFGFSLSHRKYSSRALPFKPNVKRPGLENGGIAGFHLDFVKYISHPDNLTFQGKRRKYRSRSQKRSLSAKKLNVTILILSPMLKPHVATTPG